MSRERREILDMLAEGHIGVEDAERLLDALAEGEAKRGGARSTPGPGGGFGGRIAEIVDRSVKVALGSTGETVGRLRERKRREVSARGHREEVDSTGGRFHVPEGSRLVVRNNPRHPGGGSITLRRIEGEDCEVECEGPFAVFRDEETLHVEWDYGDIEVGVPDPVHEIKAWTHGGNLGAEDLRIPLDLLTHGGDLRLAGLCRSVKARALGGNVWLGIEALDPGTESDVTTNHGDLFVSLGRKLSGTVKASTLAGRVEVEEGLGRLYESGAAGMPRTAAVEVGPEPRAAEITVRTLNGNVFLESAE